MRRRLSFALLLMAGLMPAEFSRAESVQVQLAQAQPSAQTPATQAPAAAPAPTDSQEVEEPIGSVATLTGKASVTRNDKSIPLALKDDIYLNDVVQTSANSALGVTFGDGTTFNLKASSQIKIDEFVYEEGGKKNKGLFDVAKGTVAFVAAQVAKTGDMQITTPTATLGIRGTSGLVEVPAGATATSANNVNIKLYPDADGRVGRIEVNDRAGARLGFLSQGASGFAIRPGIGGARLSAVPIAITAQMMQRDQGFVRLAQSTQTLGRRVFDEQRAFRRANPGFVNPNRPIRQPGQLRQPGQPGGPGQLRRNGLPGQPQQPGRQGLQQQPPGSPQQAISRPGGPGRPGLPARSRPASPSGTPGQVGSPAGIQPGTPAGQVRPGGPLGPPSVNQPRIQQPGGPPPLQQGGPVRQGPPGLRQPGLPGRPALQLPRRTAPVQALPKGKKPPANLR